jgi:multidrug efflux pump subunit AcrB
MIQPDEQKGLISWFAHNHVAANLLMFIIIIAGLFSVITMTKKSNPDLFIPVTRRFTVGCRKRHYYSN